MIRYERRSDMGQALVEMLLVIPLLCLMIIGIVQIALLFQAENAFEKSCADASRKYAAHLLQTPSDITIDIWNNLGSYQNYFQKQSLNLSNQAPNSTIVDTFMNNVGPLGPLLSRIKSYLINYSEQNWTITINCQPSSMTTLLFPSGIQFKSQLSFLRYPS
jgi:Flp pilus assembly protein TadG